MSVLTNFRKLARKRNSNSRHNINPVRPTSIRGVKGYLTRDDIDKLEEASKRVLKYKKNYAQKFKCGACNYEWLYSAIKCPLCSTSDIKKVA